MYLPLRFTASLMTTLVVQHRKTSWHKYYLRYKI